MSLVVWSVFLISKVRIFWPILSYLIVKIGMLTLNEILGWFSSYTFYLVISQSYPIRDSMTIPVNPNINAFYYGSMFSSKSYILIYRPFVPMPNDNPVRPSLMTKDILLFFEYWYPLFLIILIPTLNMDSLAFLLQSMWIS